MYMYVNIHIIIYDRGGCNGWLDDGGCYTFHTLILFIYAIAYRVLLVGFDI